MKKIFIKIIAILQPLLANAQSATIDGINYYLNSSTKTATFGQGSYSGDIIIPPQVTYNGVTYTVTSIGGQSFSGSGSRITSVTLPNTVTSIGMHAFWGLRDNTSIYIPSSVKAISDECAFQCDNALIHITDLEAWCSILFHPAAFYGERAPTYHRLFLNGNEIKNLVIPNSGRLSVLLHFLVAPVSLQ